MCTNQTKVYASTEEKCVKECVKAMEMLQEINIANQKKIQELSQLYMKAQKYPLFIHQMSLDQYLQKCDLFTKCADVYMQKNFKVQVSRCVAMKDTIISISFFIHESSVGCIRWWKWNSRQRYCRNCRRNWRNQRSVSIQITNIWQIRNANNIHSSEIPFSSFTVYLRPIMHCTWKKWRHLPKRNW